MTRHVDTSAVDNGKYFEVFVPDYDTSNARDSYLRLGIAAERDPTLTGNEMWGKFTEWLDQTEHGHLRDRAGHDLRPPTLTATDTAAGIYAKVGWRDHTDGNRITTTYGDKVEVIGGNYQLLVLGRQDEVGDGVVWDASAGHLVSGDIAPGMVTKIEYKSAKFGGTWKVTEETTKGHVHEVFHGEFREAFLGPRTTSSTGAIPADLADVFSEEGTGVETRGDPAVVGGTFASTIREYVGHESARVSSIVSRTYAGTIEERVNARGKITNRTDADEIDEEVDVGRGDIKSHSYAATIEEQIGKPDALTTTNTTHHGWANEYHFGGGMGITLGGQVDIFVGGHFQLDVAKTLAIVLGSHIEIHAGSFREITLGYKWDLVCGWELEVDDYSTKIDKISSKSIAAAIFLG